MEEIWKLIEGTDCYEVSNLGRIRSIDRYIKGGHNNLRLMKGKILKLNKHREGYLYAQLYINGEFKSIGVHRLVANAFILNPNNFTFINHKDENKTNNCIDNLEWCDRKYNNNYGTKNERISKANKGKVRTKEQIEKWLESRKGYKHSQETKEKIRQAMKGKIHSEEHNKKISEGMRKNKNGC